MSSPARIQRNTEQRAAIRRVFLGATRPLTAVEVLEDAHARDARMGIATVYRNLRALVCEGWLGTVELPGEPARYELAAHEHHHHFQCEACRRVFDVEGCSAHLERGLPAGFHVRAHEVVLYGTCAACA